LPKPRALFLAPEAPYPTVGGGALRSASVLEYLASKYEVDVILFRQQHQAIPKCPPAARLHVIDLAEHARHPFARVQRNMGRLVRGAPPLIDRFSGYGAEVEAFVRGHDYEVGLVEHFWCAPYLDQIATVCRRTVLDLHNIESDWHACCAQSEPWPFAAMLRRFGAKALELERVWLPKYSCVLASSSSDVSQVAEIAPGVLASFCPNTIPYVPEPPHGEDDVIVFSGNLEYLPNIHAVQYFHSKIWPILSERRAKLRWRLIGKNPHAVARIVGGDSRIELTGAVGDAIAELARGKVAVVPILSGSGTRLKILEMWAAGVPVVSTSFGAEGLGAADGEQLLIANDPVAFAARVLGLLDSSLQCRKLGAAGRLFYEQHYTWQAAWKHLKQAGI
jgi:glycosyltransferase involved in cell wall biosynthesis